MKVNSRTAVQILAVYDDSDATGDNFDASVPRSCFGIFFSDSGIGRTTPSASALGSNFGESTMRSYLELKEIFFNLRKEYGVPVRRSTISKRFHGKLLKTEINTIAKMMKDWKVKKNEARERLLKIRQKRLVREATTAELAFKSFLEQKKIKFEFQKGCKSGNCFFIVDFFLPDTKVGIEIDGSSHDGKEKKDQQRTRWLKTNGFISKMLRFKNEDIFTEMGKKKISEILAVNSYTQEINPTRIVKCPCCNTFFEIE